MIKVVRGVVVVADVMCFVKNGVVLFCCPSDVVVNILSSVVTKEVISRDAVIKVTLMDVVGVTSSKAVNVLSFTLGARVDSSNCVVVGKI